MGGAEKVRGSIDKQRPTHAFIKDRCVDCNRVLYGYVQLNTPLPEPRCSKCDEKAKTERPSMTTDDNARRGE